MERNRVQFRLIALAVVIALLFLILVARLWSLQVLQGGKFYRLAEGNRIRLIPIRAPRGLILDRKGEVLATNTPSFTVSLFSTQVEDVEGTIKKLGKLLGMEVEEVEDKIRNNGGRPFEPVKLKEGLDRRMIAIIEEQRTELPGVVIQVEPRRYYVYGNLASHLLGYIGEINKEEYPLLSEKGYRLGDWIGRTGVERIYEEYLRGENGGSQVEVDVKGYPLRTLNTREPRPGCKLILTIDRRIQSIVEEEFGKRTGAVVVIDPQSGEILAMVSRPGYDPNLFVGGISIPQWQHLSNDPHHPLTNRAIQGRYPPGSLFKIVTATASLEEELVTMEETLYCEGSFKFSDRTYKCWEEGGHGWVNIHGAIKLSCNVFFYQLGLRVGADELARYAYFYGLGQRTGIDLNGEEEGLVPDSHWKARVEGFPWFPGDTVQMAIGQGYILATPIQMVNMISAIANGGILYRPHLLKRIESSEGRELMSFKVERRGYIALSPETLVTLRKGLWSVVNEEGGTGRSAYVPGVKIVGKTGTAQNPHGEDHAWFLAYAPADNPQIAIAVIIENAGQGGLQAAPVAGRMLRRIFELETTP